MAKDVLITPAEGAIAFSGSSGAGTGLIQSDGDDLVISNAVGDVLLGDGASDVFIGDGTNNVDIVFEQNGEIRDDGSGKTINIGSKTTTLILSSSTDLTMQANGGNVGIGTSTAGETLEVIGNISASGFVSASSFAGDGAGLTNVTSTVDIDSLSALGGTGIAQSDKLLFSDAGTEKSITFSNLEDAIFGNVSGDATIAAGGALTIADDGVETDMIGDEQVTLAKLAHAAANTVLVRDANSAGDPSFKAVTNTQILIGDGTGFTAAALSGDVTMTNGGVVSVADNKIGNDELKQDDDITLQSLTTTNNISSSVTSTGSFGHVRIPLQGELQIMNSDASSTSAGTIKKGSVNNSLEITATNLEVGTLKASGDVTVGGANLHIGADNSAQWELMSHNSGLLFRSASESKYLNITDEGNVLMGKNSTADSGHKLQVTGDISASGFISTLSHITSSGNISASGTIISNDITADAVTGVDSILNTGLKIGRDSTDLIDFASSDNTIRFRVNNSDEMNLVSDSLKPHSNDGLALGASNRQWSDLFLAEGAVINFDNGDVTLTQTADNLTIAGGSLSASGDFAVSGTATVTTNKFIKTGNTDAEHQGDVVFLGGTTSMDAGKIYHYKSDGTWELADADAVANCDGLLAVALGAASDTNGMLLRGTVTLDHDPGAVGDVLFLATGGTGQATATAPSGNTDIVRVVGYCLDASNGQIWFNPDNTFVEVSA